MNKVEEHSKYIDDCITASVYDNIPVQALMDWVREVTEKEVHALEDNVPGSLEECEQELDKHEVRDVFICLGCVSYFSLLIGAS